MKNYVIGIAGVKNSGKDTVASMIQYIFAVGITKAKYQDWLIKRAALDNMLKDRITHFGDPVKDCLSIMYNIPREYFDDRNYKDNKWYCFESNTFVDEPNPNTDYCINNKLLSKYNLKDLIYSDGLRHLIKLRTLMQYFATDICRNNLANDIWIKSTMSKAVDIAETKRYCIIADVRFKNEADAIRKLSHFLYGGVIVLKRGMTEQSSHTSENIDIKGDFIIDNNETSLLQLFYNVLGIIQNIIQNG